MNELIKVNSETMTVSARDLHKALAIEKRFSAWFETNSQGFIEGEDFTSVLVGTEVQNNGGIQVRELQDYRCSVDMAKHICLMSRTAKGKECRQYLIDLEKVWNSPEMVMQRALQFANQAVARLKGEIEEMKPKAEFFDAVADSKDAIEIGQVAKVLNYPNVGRNKLFGILRDKGVLMNNNIPYQKYIDKGYFRTIEQKYSMPDGETRISIKTLVYQKGVDAIRKILNNL